MLSLPKESIWHCWPRRWWNKRDKFTRWTRRILDLRLARWQGVQVGIEGEKSPHVDDALRALDAYAE